MLIDSISCLRAHRTAAGLTQNRRRFRTKPNDRDRIFVKWTRTHKSRLVTLGRVDENGF